MLTGPEIERHIELGGIIIDPYNPSNINPNSYNVSLGDKLLVYRQDDFEYGNGDIYPLDPRVDNPTVEKLITDGGIVIRPGHLYLGTTVEHTESHSAIPMINGRSSLARLGLVVHQTGGFGDLGFRGNWTLELSCVLPLILYPGMSIAQICWFLPCGEHKPYDGKYQEQDGPTSCRYHEEVTS